MAERLCGVDVDGTGLADGAGPGTNDPKCISYRNTFGTVYSTENAIGPERRNRIRKVYFDRFQTRAFSTNFHSSAKPSVWSKTPMDIALAGYSNQIRS